MGEGHRAGAKRREWVRREDERRKDTMEAHWVANVREYLEGGGNLCSPVVVTTSDSFSQ